MKTKISASIMCADLLNMENNLNQLKDNGIDYFHCDVMDGHFVPNLMLSTAMEKRVKQLNLLPIDLHLMVENPENMIDWFSFGKGDLVAVHYESTNKLDLCLDKITKNGATAAIAINPTTPIDAIFPYLSKIGMVVAMTVIPGFAGQKMTDGSLVRLSELRSKLNNKGYSDILIQADGNCSFENSPKMQQAGADIIVAGTSSIFNSSFTIADGVKKLKEVLN